MKSAKEIEKKAILESFDKKVAKYDRMVRRAHELPFIVRNLKKAEAFLQVACEERDNALHNLNGKYGF